MITSGAPPTINFIVKEKISEMSYEVHDMKQKVNDTGEGT
jgi:hypothetical protein